MEPTLTAPLEITDAEALAVIGQILLALRHPENKGPSAALAKQWAKKLASSLLERIQIPPELVREWERQLWGASRGT